MIRRAICSSVLAQLLHQRLQAYTLRVSGDVEYHKSIPPLSLYELFSDCSEAQCEKKREDFSQLRKGPSHVFEGHDGCLAPTPLRMPTLRATDNQN
jgi:hypothetical protein